MSDLDAGASLDASAVEVQSPFTGVVVDVLKGVGEPVAAGAAVLVVESMKMHHEVDGAGTRPRARRSRSTPATRSATATCCSRSTLEEGAASRQPRRGAASDARRGVRADLAGGAASRRARRLDDDARPTPSSAATAPGRRTARENVDDLCDAGSFVEYGALALAAQRGRRSSSRT